MRVCIYLVLLCVFVSESFTKKEDSSESSSFSDYKAKPIEVSKEHQEWMNQWYLNNLESYSDVNQKDLPWWTFVPAIVKPKEEDSAESTERDLDSDEDEDLNSEEGGKGEDDEDDDEEDDVPQDHHGKGKKKKKKKKKKGDDDHGWGWKKKTVWKNVEKKYKYPTAVNSLTWGPAWGAKTTPWGVLYPGKGRSDFPHADFGSVEEGDASASGEDISMLLRRQKQRMPPPRQRVYQEVYLFPPRRGQYYRHTY